MLINGITGCGKTHFVLDLLETEFRNKFDYIFILCPTFQWNKTYNRKFIFSDPHIFPVVINNQLNGILERLIVKYGDHKEQTLIVIDDCANLYDAKLKATALTKLAFHGRHVNLSTWILTQKYNAVVKDFRENIKMLVLFYDKDRESRAAAFKENDISISASDKERILNTLKNDKSSKVIMRLVHPFGWRIL